MRSAPVAFIFLLAASFSFAQPENAGLPPVRNFVSQDYKAALENWSCIQDKRGILYFANESGVLEYDGGIWNLIRVDGDKPIRSFALDSSGRVYVGCVNDFGYLESESGASRYQSLRSLLPDTAIQFQEVWKTHALKDEVIFHSDNKLFRYKHNRVTITPVISTQDYSFAVDNQLFVYQSNIGLCELIKDTVIIVPGGDFYKNKRIRTILPYSKNLLLIGTENGIYLYDGRASRRFITEADKIFTNSRIFDGVVLQNSQFAFGTVGAGVVLVDKTGKLLYHINKKNGLVSNFAFALCSDREDGVWAAQLYGISRIDFPSPVTILDSRSGYDNTIFSLIEHKNNLFLGTANGLYEQSFSDTENRFTIQLKALPSQDVAALLSFEDGILAGCGEGTFFYKNGVAQKISPAYSVYFTRSKVNPNLVYACDYSVRLLNYFKGKWIDNGIIQGIQESIRFSIENEDGSLWLFTYYEGIIHVSNHFHKSGMPVITRYGINEGLPSLNLNSPVIISNKLYFSTIKGLYTFNPDKQRFIFASNIHSIFTPPLPIAKMFIYEEGDDVYVTAVSSNEGNEMLHYRRSDENRYIAFTNQLGYLNKLNVTPLYNAASGLSWYVFGDQLFRVDRRMKRNVVPFETRIGRARFIANDSLIYPCNKINGNNDDAKIPYSIASIRFEFSATSFIGNENEFQYFMEGSDQSWSDWSTERYKEYTQLQPGNYRFRVRSKNIYGITGREASFAFTILPPWWGTWWFRIFAVLTGLAVVFMLAQKISARRIILLKAEEEKRKGFSRQLIESQEQERKRIASELHDSIGQNLLIIKNMLDVSAGNLMTKEELNSQLKELSDIAASSIEETRNIASNLHPYQLNRLGLSKAFSALMRNLESSTKINITYSLDDVQGLLNKETEAHIYRIVQESINNILKHSAATALNFVLKRNPNELIIMISDDGKGFNVKEYEPSSGTLIGGLGLFGLKERAMIIGGRLNISSEPGKGTKIELSVPVEVEV